jgi:hypothetical protein
MSSANAARENINAAATTIADQTSNAVLNMVVPKAASNSGEGSSRGEPFFGRQSEPTYLNWPVAPGTSGSLMATKRAFRNRAAIRDE